MNANQKVCTRCSGTGKHSFNAVHGDMCYGCNGKGWVYTTPKGQKKIKPTATLATCKVGDIVEINKRIVEITSIRWIKATWRGYDFFNQVVRYTCLASGDKLKTWRGVRIVETRDLPLSIEEYRTLKFDWKIVTDAWADMLEMYPDGDCSAGASGNSVHTTFQVNIKPTEEMIGTEVE